MRRKDERVGVWVGRGKCGWVGGSVGGWGECGWMGRSVSGWRKVWVGRGSVGWWGVAVREGEREKGIRICF